jgi:hypothetical protein
MFTEMDWSISAGMSVNGWSWGRWGDTLGVAFNIGGLHGAQKRFYKAGGPEDRTQKVDLRALPLCLLGALGEQVQRLNRKRQLIPALW